MKVYIVLHKDKHIDENVKPFVTLERAISYANEVAFINDRFEKFDPKIHGTFPNHDGWVYEAIYGEEGCGTRVYETDL